MKLNRESLIKVIKIAAGSALAVFVSEGLGLQYATSAGIITFLTIQNTKKATLQLSLNRFLSFLVTVILSVVLISVIGGNVISFGIFMLILTGVSYRFSWDAAISVNAVLGTHFILMEQQVTLSFLLNETCILAIGTIIAILLNFRMPNKEDDLHNDIDYIENSIKELLFRISRHLQKKEKIEMDKESVGKLIQYIDKAIDKAFANRENTLKDHSHYYIEYLIMRKNQCIILMHVARGLIEIKALPDQAMPVTDLIHDIASEYSIKNDASKRLERLHSIADFLDDQPLPKTKTELHERAVLFQIVKELEEFLRVKHEFLQGMTEEQKEIYWGERSFEDNTF